MSWRCGAVIVAVSTASACRHCSMGIRGHPNLGCERGNSDHQRKQR
jgi:hypothetical protein